ncbi:MAG: TatD family hydrolase, partial [Ruminiclostridium sp.]|nr:TatD family hydrolase [Ruminiclostridium sp.]
PETAKELVAMGLYISFTGVLTFKNAKKAVSACRVIPTDRLMLETDCPYMSPVPFRGERCDSSMIQYTAAKMGEIKGFGAEEMIDICNKNADRFFGLGST